MVKTGAEQAHATNPTTLTLLKMVVCGVIAIVCAAFDQNSVSLL
jgi:hypothetical protein